MAADPREYLVRENPWLQSQGNTSASEARCHGRDTVLPTQYPLSPSARRSQYLTGFAYKIGHDFRRWPNVMHQPYGLASPNNIIINGPSAAAELARNRIPSNDIALWCAANFIALSGAQSGFWPTCILPELDSSIAERATRRIRPSTIEQHALNCIGRSCLDEALLVVRMIRGFR